MIEVEIAFTTRPPCRLALLLVKPPVPMKLAVTVWFPADSTGDVSPDTAIPLVTVTGEPRLIASTANCTVPVAAEGATAAVKATDCPYDTGFRELETVIVVEVALPSSTVIVLSVLPMTARSNMPSPLKSPVVIPRGPAPVASGLPVATVKLPVPVPRSTVTLLSASFATARSSLPSPSKSPATRP